RHDFARNSLRNDFSKKKESRLSWGAFGSLLHSSFLRSNMKIPRQIALSICGKLQQQIFQQLPQYAVSIAISMTRQKDGFSMAFPNIGVKRKPDRQPYGWHFNRNQIQSATREVVAHSKACGA
ncbi:MAG: hypothetical protein JW808_02615, partial [Victivallales bacterium]|nr:hypothetical protein [Victivallales bacterium]